MSIKLFQTLLTWLILPMCLLILFYSTLPLYTPPLSTNSLPSKHSTNSSIPPCDLFKGHWVIDPNRRQMYDETCPFHRNSWNCLKNKRDNMDKINSWKWTPDESDLPQVNPLCFMGLMRNKRIRFVEDSLNENFLVSFLCILRIADVSAKKRKRKGASEGHTFRNSMSLLHIIEPYCLPDTSKHIHTQHVIYICIYQESGSRKGVLLTK